MFLCAVLILTQTQTPHAVKDTLPDDFGAKVPYGLGELPPVDPQSARLGRKLFFDPALSADGKVSCASCHLPEHAFSDPRPRSVGIHGRLSTLHSPTLLNRALGSSFFWDGRSRSLEEQALEPLTNEREMGRRLEDVEQQLNDSAEYRALFESAYASAPTRALLARALSDFQRTIRMGDSPVDRFQEGDFEALSVEERLGLWIYESKGGCWRCHSGPNFSDERLHNTGVGALAQAPTDTGKFKTPTLRGLGSSAPYMHDGSMATLEEVVEFYNRGGGANPGLAQEVKPLNLSSSEVSHLAAFLRALSRTSATPRTSAAPR
ncbi:MAG: cytochrome-c peroxidase [Planctomycetia bacterium]